MTRHRPSFPPDVADALQRPEGSASVRYTVSAALAHGPRVDTVLMETPYEQVLAALTLDTKRNLHFVRTGNRAEGARVALVNIAPLLAAGRHLHIEMTWDEGQCASPSATSTRPAGLSSRDTGRRRIRSQREPTSSASRT